MKSILLPGKLTISRVHSSKTGDCVRVGVTDTASGCQFLELSVNMAEFAQALTGLGYVDCQFEVNTVNVGKVSEHKVVMIDVSAHKWVKSFERDAVAAELLKPYEVDGWKGRADDCFNHHNIKNGKAAVGFFRYVDPKESIKELDEESSDAVTGAGDR